MKISTKNQIIERKNSDLCVVTEYPMIDSALDFAIVNLSGKYPPEKRAVNTQCKEIVYVQKGHGEVTVDNKKHIINEGDVILIDAGEKFTWEGQMILFISCNPAFTIEQHLIVD